MIKTAERNFVHFSAEPVAEVLPGDQYGGMTDYGAKPDGLWFCLNGSRWRQFLSAREISPVSQLCLRCRTKVAIQRPEHFVMISDPHQLMEFSAEYSTISSETMTGTGRSYRNPPMIDWPRVALTFHGVVIDLEPADHNFAWFRSWDIPSGCVWNGRYIQLTPLN